MTQEPEPATAPLGELDATALRRLWPEILEAVKLSSRRTRALLDNAQITGAAGEVITLRAPTKLAVMIAEESNTSVLGQALTKVVGGSWRIDVQPAATTAPATEGQSLSESTVVPSSEPDPRDDTDPPTPAGRLPALDPEAEALKLLHDQLGARPVDDS